MDKNVKNLETLKKAVVEKFETIIDAYGSASEIGAIVCKTENSIYDTIQKKLTSLFDDNFIKDLEVFVHEHALSTYNRILEISRDTCVNSIIF